jgi:ABC-type transport system involved in multi-copper enzyme maturation permease subunit
MALLHLQLGIDVLIGVFWLMLVAWPKGGAVALSAFREGVRHPMFWLLTVVATVFMFLTPFIPYFTFGEDAKMVRELCYSFVMLAAAIFCVLNASISVSEEIEGRTAVTLMSKPVSRRQFLLGKFYGILLSAAFMTLLLGWVLILVMLFQPEVEMGSRARLEPPPLPAWVLDLANAWFGRSAAADLFSGIGFWIHDMGTALPGLIIGSCQVLVLLAISVALATRVPMVVNVIACLFVYFLGHLTPIMTEVTRNQLALVYFVAQVFDLILPGFDLFDVGTAIVRDSPLPAIPYALYTLNVTIYALVYGSIALLFGLILFEDRDLA